MPEARLLLAGFLSLVAGIAPGTAKAQESTETPPELREYAVEVIVFRYADGVYRGTELFPPDPPPQEPLPETGIPEFGDVAGLGGAAETPDEAEDPTPALPDGSEDPDAPSQDETANPDGTLEQALDEPGPGYSIMPGSELTMGETLDRLERLDAYEPILHFGWRQRLTAFGESEPIPLATLTAPAPGLDGSFELYLSRFLHLAVELEQLAEPGPPDARLDAARTDPLFDAGARLPPAVDPLPGFTDEPKVYYRINEDRIFKSGDLRYFDHPRFGVLVKIDRVERDATEPDAPGTGEEMLGDVPPGG